MKVTLDTFGGFAAGIQRPQRGVDATMLAPADAAELARRVSAAASAPALSAAPETVRDGMSYAITIDEKGSQTVLEQSDGAMSTEFAVLLDFLAEHGR
jgi:hypothetical protein